MNLSTAVFLISDEVRAIGVTFDQGNERTESVEYTYKTCDQTISVGDYVIVPVGASEKFKIVTVRSVDVDVNYNSDIQYKWVAAKFDPIVYIMQKEHEQRAIQEIKQIERRAKREQLRKDLVEFGGDEMAGVRFLAISNLSSSDDLAESTNNGTKE